MLSALALAALVGDDVPSPCTGAAPAVEVAPGPSETGLPANLSLWFRVTGRWSPSLDGLHVRLLDVASERELPLDAEAVMLWHAQQDGRAAQAAYRFTPREPLDVGRTYAVSWLGGYGESEGHVFVVGAPALVEPPPPPGAPTITSPEVLACGSERAVVVQASTAARFLVATLREGVRGFDMRGEAAVYLDGAPGDPVEGELVAMDLAGNRSVAVPFAATTPKVSPPPVRDLGGCSAVPADGALSWAAALAAIARARRAARRRGQAPRAFWRRAAMYSRVNTAPFS